MILYHYTDAQAIQSILVNHKIWLTDLRFMNDSTELRHGIKWFKAALKQQPYGLFHDSNHVEQAILYLAESLSEYENAESQQRPIFSMSFSEVDDLLSQWRAYGGYSIAFDSDRLRDCGFNLNPCLYDDSLKSDRALSAMSRALATISNDMAVNAGCIGVTAIDEVTALIERAATFKDSGFAEEREVRMTAYSDVHKVRFRSGQGILLPYIEVDLPLEAVVGVRVGPIRDQNLASFSMRMFVHQMENDYQANGGDIEWCLPVRKSITPYRER